MATAFRIAAKDLRQRLRDRSALMVALVLPLALAFIYSSLFGAAAAPRAFAYGVVDLDRGAVAAVFVSGVLPRIEDQGYLTVRALDDVASARRLVDGGSLDAAFVLPAGFTAAVQSQAAAEIEVIGSVDAPTGTDVARSIARSFAADLNGVRLAVAAALDGNGAGHGALAADQVAAVAQRAVDSTAPVRIVDVSATAKVLDLKTYVAAGMAVFFLFFTVQFGLASILDERAEGTLARLLAAPIRPLSVLAGKLLASIGLGLASMAVLVTATTVLMRISWGDPAGVALLVVAAVLAATGVTSLVASLARTPDQAGSWQAIVSVLLGLIGGAFFPLSQAGGLAATVSLASPHAWFLRGLGELAGGGGPTATLPAVGAMLAFAAVTLTVAGLRWRTVVRP
jgi:ABC-2 type transport system permease protein